MTKPREGLFLRGTTWWIRYSHRGVQYRESARTESIVAAGDFLKKRQSEIYLGRFMGPIVESTTFDDLVMLIRQDYTLAGRRSARTLEFRLARLRDFFGKMFAAEVSLENLTAYVLHRQSHGAANGTIKIELSTMGRMLSLAVRHRRLGLRPPLPVLKVDNVRTGFFTDDEIARVQHHAPHPVNLIARFGYLTGWRLNEILNLQWKSVTSSEMRLASTETKSGVGRVFPVTEPLDAILSERRALLDAFMKRTGRIIPWVWTWENGSQVRDIRRQWRQACVKAGLPDRLFHDLRRSAIRNMVRAGVPEAVAMKLSGHQTRAVFDRYNIVSGSDLLEAAKKMHRLG